MITGAGANGQLPGLGPQLPQATAGDKVLLQARIYNDSLVDIPSTDTIVVRFYAEPWNPTRDIAAGNAFLIDTQTLDGLPGFNSSTATPSHPNWTLVGTSKLDTAAHSNQYLLFWVLVYVENGKQLVAELPQHGLTHIPPANLTSVSDSLSYLEPYSNNLGVYKYAFYIAPKSSGLTVSKTSAKLAVKGVRLSAARVKHGGTVIISGLVHSAADVDGISMAYSDGPPGDGGEIFDIDDISHIRAGESHMAETAYHAESCGTHDLYLYPLDVPLSRKAIKFARLRVTCGDSAQR